MEEGNSSPGSPTNPPAGWYDDPTQPGQRRYWSGQQWTDDIVSDEQAQHGAVPYPPGQSTESDWSPPTASPSQPSATWTPPITGSTGENRSTTPLKQYGLIAGVLVILAVAVLAVGSSGSTRNLAGEFALYDDQRFSSYRDGATCTGSGGYRDINAGTHVEVFDGTGELIGVVRLGAGAIERDFNRRPCVFPFRVTDLPRANIYRVSVSHRGVLSYTEQELNDSGWYVVLELGR